MPVFSPVPTSLLSYSDYVTDIFDSTATWKPKILMKSWYKTYKNKQRIADEKATEQVKKLTSSFKAIQPKELLSIHERLSGNSFSWNNEKEGFSKT